MCVLVLVDTLFTVGASVCISASIVFIAVGGVVWVTESRTGGGSGGSAIRERNLRSNSLIPCRSIEILGGHVGFVV